jgi:hypothetical protein
MSLKRFPLEDLLGQGAIKERDFRARLDAFDWEPYRDQAVLIPWIHHAELPIWVYLMSVARLADVAAVLSYGEECSPTVLRQRGRIEPAIQGG